MKIAPMLLLAVPWMVVACDDLDAYDEAELPLVEENKDREHEDGELAPAAEEEASAVSEVSGPETLVSRPADPQEGLVCELLCLLHGNHPTCGADGHLHKNACLAACEGGGAVPTGTYWPDDDGDGFGDANASPTKSCAPCEGLVANDDDCDDTDEATAPGQPETCDGIDNDCDPANVCIPADCSDVRSDDAAASDGEYTLYVDNDPARPWTAYCHDMADTQAVYLTLVAVGEGHNFSQYTAANVTPGTTVRTYFTKVRIDPSTFAVEYDDVTFTSSTGQLKHGDFVVDVMPYGVASGCSYQPDGLANVDLTGTPFRILDNFCTYGTPGVGDAVLSANDKIADITGGGGCGWTSPGCTINPHERVNSPSLELEYVGP